MRRLLAALQVSVDGFIEGPNGELDWAMAEDEETWRELNDTLLTVDTFVLGRVMYSAYEQYWLGLLTNPAAGSKNEVAYAPVNGLRMYYEIHGAATGAKSSSLSFVNPT